MCLNRSFEPIRVGVLTDEPISRLGFTSIFEEPPSKGCAQLSPVFGQMEELLSDATLNAVNAVVAVAAPGSSTAHTLGNVTVTANKVNSVVQSITIPVIPATTPATGQ